jgi:hypothetical protein
MYQMTCDEYEELRAETGNTCTICGIAGELTKPGLLYLDHDEQVDIWAVRGLLCPSCNVCVTSHPRKIGLDRVAAYFDGAWYRRRLAAIGQLHAPHRKVHSWRRPDGSIEVTAIWPDWGCGRYRPWVVVDGSPRMRDLTTWSVRS